MNSYDQDQLRSLAQAYVENDLTAEDRGQLETLLRTGEEARLFFLSYLEVHAGLAWEFRGEPSRVPPFVKGMSSQGIDDGSIPHAPPPPHVSRVVDSQWKSSRCHCRTARFGRVGRDSTTPSAMAAGQLQIQELEVAVNLLICCPGGREVASELRAACCPPAEQTAIVDGLLDILKPTQRPRRCKSR